MLLVFKTQQWDHPSNESLETVDIYIHSILMAISPGEPGLAGCPFSSSSPFIPKLSMSFITQSHQVFGHVIQHLTQSLIIIFTFKMSKPFQPTVLFLIVKLTVSNPKSSPCFLLFFQSASLHTSFNRTQFSAIQLHFMICFHRPGLTAICQITPHTSSIYLAF